MTTFEGGSGKAASNIRKHNRFRRRHFGIEDDQVITLREDMTLKNAGSQLGWILARILVVAYTWRGNSIRIISARSATPTENSNYMENT